MDITIEYRFNCLWMSANYNRPFTQHGSSDGIHLQSADGRALVVAQGQQAEARQPHQVRAPGHEVDVARRGGRGPIQRDPFEF